MIPLKTSVYRIIDMTLWCTEVNCYSSFTGLMTIFRNQSGMMVILYRSAKSKIKWGTARHVFWNRTRYGQRLEHRHHCYELDPSPPPPPTPSHTHTQTPSPPPSRQTSQTAYRHALFAYAFITSEPCPVRFWCSKLEVKLEKQPICMQAKQCTKETGLRLLHWKIWHNIILYPMGIFLNKMGIPTSTR